MGYSPHLLYALISDASGTVLLHTERRKEGQSAPERPSLEDAEKALIIKTLAANGNNKTRAADVLGISLKTLHNKLKAYGS